MIDAWLGVLSRLIEGSVWLAPLMALLAGVLTSLTPCSLSTIPLVIGYVGGAAPDNSKKAFRLSLTFAGGMAVTFSVLGTIASLAGNLVGSASSWWYIALGVLMVLMALQTWEIFRFIPSTHLIGKSTKRGYFGALIAGILGGIFSSPCATPVLIVLLALVAGKGSLLWGFLLLLLYSAGNSALVIVAGTSMGFIQRIICDPRYGKWSQVVKIVLGCIILLIAFYMFYLGF